MRWLQSTWTTRFNRYRKRNSKLFQGRFKSLIVDESEYLGPLLHYVHLNPVRAAMCSVENLLNYRWSSYWYLSRKKKRPDFLHCASCLNEAGGLANNQAWYRKYRDYLLWLPTHDEAQKKTAFNKMCRGWALGSKSFKQETLESFALSRASQREGGESSCCF